MIAVVSLSTDQLSICLVCNVILISKSDTQITHILYQQKKIVNIICCVLRNNYLILKYSKITVAVDIDVLSGQLSRQNYK